MSIKQLSEKRGALLKEADLICRNASVEKRAISGPEDIRLDSIKREVLDIDVSLAREKQSLRSEEQGLEIDASQYSICRAMRGASIGRLDGYEAEVSQEIALRSGKPADGFYLPHAALIEQRSGMGVTINSGANGSNAVATEVRGFIDSLRPYLAVARAGATLMSGLTSDVGIPRHAAASTAGWKSEVTDHDESTPAIEQLLLQPKRIGAWTKYSKQLIAQSSIDVEAFVRNDLMQAIAVGFDSAAINGTGASNQPTGILATSGIGSVVGGTNGLAPTWAHLTALVAAVANVNAVGSKPGFMFSTKIESKLRSTVKVASTDSKMILEEGQATLVGNPWYASNNVPDNLTKGTATAICSAIIFGNWADVILASFGEGVDVIVDPFTLATSSQTRVVVNSLCDVGVRRAASFAAAKDMLSA
ncbi:MAG: phage major capsid protein [Luteolibacter sp.]